MSSTATRLRAVPAPPPSAGEVCRHILSSARTGSGRFIPVGVKDLMTQLVAAGFPVNEADVLGLLRGLVALGEAMEIDEESGFRWIQPAA